jgi:hypothetical protein
MGDHFDQREQPGVLALVVRQMQAVGHLVDRDGTGVSCPPHLPEVEDRHFQMGVLGL